MFGEGKCLKGKRKRIKYKDAFYVFSLQNLRVGTDIWKAGLEVMSSIDKLLAVAIANDRYQFEFPEDTDFHKYVVGLRLRNTGLSIPLPNLTSGPYQERYYKTCSTLGKYLC